MNYWFGLAGWIIAIIYAWIVFFGTYRWGKEGGKASKEIHITDLTEDLADLAHCQWTGWMEYLFEKSMQNEDGTVTIPKWAVSRWKRQIITPYKDLPDEEKESDREEARRVLGVIFK